MKLSQILKNLKYKILIGEDREIGKLTIDSRKANIGDVYIAISGLSHDGHNYLQNAYENGARIFIIEKELENYPDGTIVLVDNTRKAMALMASNYYDNPSKKLNIIGVTGTNGKTSVVYFINSILEEYGRKTGIITTVETKAMGENIDILTPTSTTPDPIELHHIFKIMVDRGVEDVIMEVTSHALELHKVDGIVFNHGIFTNLTQDHLDFHKNMEEYRNAKSLLFKNSKNSIINVDDKYGNYMIESCFDEFYTYGVNVPSNLKAKNIIYSNKDISFDIFSNGNSENIYIPVPGDFTVYNGLAAISLGISMKIPMDIIKEALRKFKGVPGRIESLDNENNIGIFVDYAHTPDSLLNIIKSVKKFTKGNVITVFGCGGDRDKTKRPIMGKIAGENSDYTIITSDNPRSENPKSIIEDVEVGIKGLNPYIKITDRKEAIFKAIELAKAEDSIIIAGKGHETYQIFADKTIDFDDLKIAKEALEYYK